MKTLALLVMALLALQTPAQPDMSATIEGRVTLYGTTQAIPKVQITIRSTGSGRFQADSVTDSWGHFIFAAVPAGVYDITALRGGFANAVRNGLRVPDGSQRTVAVAPQQRLDDADLVLVRGGVITGRILDANGRPIPRLQVEARYIESGGAISDFGSRTVDTDDKGEYRLFDLDPGKYIVSAEYRQRGAAAVVELQGSWVKTYFPGVAAVSKASALDIEEGSVVRATDFAIQSAAKFMVSGIVTTPRVDPTGLSFSGVFLVPSDAGTSSRERRIPASVENVAPQRTSPGNMRFDIRTEPGSYELFVQVLDARNRTGFAGRAFIQVNHQDVKDIVVDTSGALVKGKVLVTGRVPGPVGSLGVRLFPVDFPSIVTVGLSPGVFDTNGNFSTSNIPNGKWSLVTTNVPSDLTITDIRQGSVSIPRDGIQVVDKTAEPLQIIFSPAGLVDGFVRDGDQKPIAAMRVVAYPYNQPPAAEAHQATSDASGHFVLTGLAPGEHLLFAVPSVLLSGAPIFAEALDIKPVLAPYQSQGTIVKVSSGATSYVILAPLQPKAPSP